MLFCLIGKSGVGKDTLLQKILDCPDINITPLITYTTRPQRDGEIDGVHYHFVSEVCMNELDAAGKILEKREYHTVFGTWYYFTVMFEASGNYIINTHPQGIKEMTKRISDMKVILLEADDYTRLNRSIARESRQKKPNYSEVCRRYLADEEEFKIEPSCGDIIKIDTSGEIQSCLAQIIQILTE